MPTCVYTAKNPTDGGPHVEILGAAGFNIVVPPPGCDVFVEDQLIALLKDAEAVIAGSEPYTPRVIASLPRLRCIVRAGVGFDAVNLEACDKAGIPVCTTPGVNHHSVAEHTIALLMGVARGFPLLDDKVRRADWARRPYGRVMGKTLGLVGLGRIGQATATRAVGLGMNVIAYEPLPNEAFVKQWKIELVDLDTLLARSDFVSLHLPSMKETFKLFNKARFERMKKGAVLINTARGSLVDEEDLYEALKSGHLGGAGLDVFQVEPLPLSSPLLTLDNVLVSGHVAGLDDQSLHDTNKMCAELVVKLSRNEWPEGCVQNMKTCSGWTWRA
jgi:phosphoglycerate dehydrogenase-like enzyme